MSEVESFASILEQHGEGPCDLNPILAVSISNVICSMIMSMRFTHDDARFRRFMDLIDEGFRLFGTLAPVNFIPILRHLPWLQETRTKLNQVGVPPASTRRVLTRAKSPLANLTVLLSQNRQEMADFFQETVEDHRASFDPSNMRDLVDTYLLEIQKAREEGRDGALFEGKNHDRQMQQIIGDLFSAGMETIKTTLQWAVVFMLHHPEIMKQVQEELDSVVGRDRLPSLEDLAYLPYTESTILEVLRRSSIVPLGTTHATTRDVTLNGFHIPKDTHIVPLLHAVHMDPNLWEEPESFQPSRFLSAEGKVTKPDYFLPFGAGK